MAAARSLSVAVEVSNNVQPTLKVTSDSRNGNLSDFVPVYSPGRSRKKKAMIIMSETACSSGSLEAANTQASRRRTWNGIGLTQDGIGSCWEYQRNCSCSLPSIFPVDVIRGSLAPSIAIACPIDRILDRTPRLSGAMLSG